MSSNLEQAKAKALGDHCHVLCESKPGTQRPYKWRRWNCVGDLQGSTWGERGRFGLALRHAKPSLSLAWESYNQNLEKWLGCKADSKDCTLLSTPNFKNGNEEFGLDLSWLHFSRRWDKGKCRQQMIFELASKSTRGSFKSLGDKIQPPRELHAQLQGRGIRPHQEGWD